MAERFAPVAEKIVASCDIGPTSSVLDVACGTGNLAIAAADRGAHALGLDLEPVLLDIARSRTDADVEWRRSDLAPLDAPSDAFDLVGSVFGAMYATDHQAAARELGRVCKPTGKVIITAWTPGSFMPSLGAALAPFLPPPPGGSGPPTRWGDPDALKEILGAGGLELTSAHEETVEMRFATVHDAVEFIIRTAGHIVAERDALETSGRWNDLRATISQHVSDSAQGDQEPVRLRMDYLLAVAAPVS